MTTTETGENVETSNPTDVQVVTDLVDADGDDIAVAVRHWETDRRTAAVLSAMSAGNAVPTDLFAAIMAVDYVDPTTRDAVADTVTGELERLARLMLAADDTADVAAEFAAALSRVAPTDVTDADRAAVVATVNPPSTRRTRQRHRYDVTGHHGTYSYPACDITGSDPGQITLRVDSGIGTWVTADGTEFNTPTGALRHAQGFIRGQRGNNGGWEGLTRVGGANAGKTLADLARIR